jgi:spore germination protein KA/spore germination protein
MDSNKRTLKEKKVTRKSRRNRINTQPTSDHDPISPTLSDNLERVKKTFTHCHDLIIHHWRYGLDFSHQAFSVYFDTLVQNKKYNFMKEALQDLVTHIVGPGTMITPEEVITFFERHGASAQTATLVDNFNQCVQFILSGHVIIFFNQWNKALSFQAINVETRQISEPIAEPVVKGPRESTTENLQKNLGLLRARLKSPRFKIETFSVQGETNTEVAFGYLEGSVNPDTLAEFKKRISQVKEGEILETSYVEEMIEDSSYSPFPQHRYTERPDTAVASLLDGKIIVLVEGTGSILICPGLFVEFLQSSEDYYQRTIFSSLIRLMRVFAFIIALLLPSVYIAVSTFHPELIPTTLLLAVVDTREGIPFPTFVEAFIMEFFFELLREAGVRLPRPVGTAVSIVGALVIGEAAITAGIASPLMVIIVALTGIASFALPQYNFAITLRILRFPLMLLAALLGGFGLMIGVILLWVHLQNLQPLGQPYLTYLGPFRPKQWRDILIRAPLKQLFRSARNRHLYVRKD